MAVNPKTLEECSAWLKKANARDKARFAAKQAAAKPEGATSLNKALEESRRRAGGLTAADVSKQTGTARFVSWVNGISKAHDDADRAAAERAAQRMQKGPAPSAGANAASSNPRPQQVDANGRMTGDIKDPQIGAGRVTPLTVASTADGGPAAIFDFFNRRKRNGSN
ncbi:hypothetical protein [Burkholderia pseudomallei]|uniref:hypothetical protein n=1 Tax=Burkholderia pseudomallei TaxID=28450 RepID=UPI0006A61893|nr:hypothetical protein [Burkholderia pseudomallei]